METSLIDNKEKILELHKNNYSNRKIGKEIGVSAYRISKFISNFGLKTNNPRYSRDENFMEILDSPEKAYFLGWIASDGNLMENIYSIRLTIQDRDRDVLELFSKILKTNKPLQFMKRGKDHWMDSYRLQINSKKMYYDIIKYGVHPNKTSTIYLPEEMPDNLFKYYLRGYFEGDGNLNPRKKGMSASFCISCKSEKMLIQLANKIEDLTGIKLSISKSKFDVYLLRCGGTVKVLKLMDWIYSERTDLHLNRKYQTYLNLKDDYSNLKSKQKRVIQFSLDGEFVKEWKSMMDATNFLGKSKSFFSDKLKRKNMSETIYGGFIWKLV